MSFILAIGILAVAQFSRWLGNLHQLRKAHTLDYKNEQEQYYRVARILNYIGFGLIFKAFAVSWYSYTLCFFILWQFVKNSGC